MNDKKTIYKKWWFWCLIFLVILFFVGYGAFVNDMSSDENLIKDIEEKYLQSDKGEINNCYIEIGDYAITNDYSGNPILLVKVSFTNNNEESKAFSSIINSKAFQDGIEIEPPISTYGINDYNWQDKSKEVQKGIKFEFNLAFKLSNTTSDVIVELSQLLNSSNSKKITKTFKMN